MLKGELAENQKIIEDATNFSFIRFKCTKFNFGLGSAAYSTGKLTAIPRLSIADKGRLGKKKGRDLKERVREREMDREE